MRRVSSLVRARATPAGASFPLISTSGGFPGEKKRSLIFGEVLSIAASRAGMEIGAGAGAAAAAVPGEGEVMFATGFVREDIEAVQLSLSCVDFVFAAEKPGEQVRKLRETARLNITVPTAV